MLSQEPPCHTPFDSNDPTNKIEILFQNIQSINNKLEILESFMEQNETYLAYCITETWLSEEKMSLINLNNYHIVSAYCRKKRCGGGVCIILKDGIEYIERTDIMDMTIEFLVELCAIELYKQNMILITLYWNGKQVDSFFNQLDIIMIHLKTKYANKKVIIGGDFNIDILKHNLESKRLVQLMTENNFSLKIRDPTRTTQISSTCIDLIFTNFDDKLMKALVVDNGFSDHKSTILQLPYDQNNNHNPIIWQTKKRLFNNTNIQTFKKVLQSIDWNTIIISDKNINQNYDSFDDTLILLLDKYIPKKLTKIYTKRKKQWLTKGIKISCKNKRLLSIHTNHSKSIVLKNHYKHYQKSLKKCIIASKKLEYIKRVKKSNNRVKTMWTIIKERTNKLSKPSYQNITLNVNNKRVSEPKQVANTFNEYFATVGEPSACALPPQGRPAATFIEKSIYLRPIDHKEINAILRNLPNKHSHGLDEIPPILFKECADELTAPFYVLVNQSFVEGVYPDRLKKAVIKPLHKKGTKLAATNYRPIALLPTSSKVFEKAMYNRIYPFCEKFKIFDENQNGFRKNRSTMLAIFKYIQEALNILNNKKYGIGILLDMTKAYDKIQYHILLNKLHAVGIRGIAYEWFKSYLQNRQHIVETKYFDHKTRQISNISSDTRIINHSIPQGSVLGCILFLIYINDLPKSINQTCVLFADDISLITPYSDSDDLDLNTTVKVALDDVVNWLNDHNLEINFSKTKIIQFRPYQKAPLTIDFTYKDINIESVNNFTLLGIDIDTNINWKAHVEKIALKLSRFTYALWELKKSTNEKTAVTAYYAYAYAWLSYGVIVWGNSSQVDSLLILQKKCIRIIKHLKNTDSCKPYFKSLEILTLPSIYILETAKFVRRYPSFYTREGDQQRRFPTRYPNRLILPKSKMEMYRSSPLTMSIKIFNKIPENIKIEQNTASFIKKLKHLLIQKTYYTIYEFLNDQNLNDFSMTT